MRLSKAKRADILRRVARHIERYPEKFDFMRGDIPKRGCPACMLARAGVFMGYAPHGAETPRKLDEIAKKLGFSAAGTDPESAFYTALEQAVGYAPSKTPDGYSLWQDTPRIAKGMRALADAL